MASGRAVLAADRAGASRRVRTDRLKVAAFAPWSLLPGFAGIVTPADMPPGVSARMLERVTEAAFGQRRKMLRSSLKSLVQEPERLLAAAQIDPELRAEQVPVEGFARMAALL